MRTHGLSPGACNVYIRSINSFLTWLHDDEHTPTRLKVKLLPNERKLLTPFTDAHVKAVLSHKAQAFHQLRTWTVINVLVDTGCRIDEILTLRIDCVDLEALTMKVMGKGRKERRVPFSFELRKVVFRYLQKRDKYVRGDYVFGTNHGLPMRYRNVYRDVLVLCTRAGVVGPRVSPHTFRHFFAVGYIRNGGNIYNLSRILGHTSVKTTELYLRTMGVEQVAKSIRGCRRW
jgi:integrase/recombinase XerD